MYPLLLLGAGKIGRVIAGFLAHCGDYDLLVADADEAALARIADRPHLHKTVLDARDAAALRRVMAERRAVVSACPFFANEQIAIAALESGISYFDLTEDVATRRAVQDLAREAKTGQILMPQCGLAPGFVVIAGYHLTEGFERVDEVRLRVGALSLFPTNRLQYNLTWSTDGLINEYCNPCEAIREGKPTQLLPLEGLECFSLDGVSYEAFNTSGGVGTLCQTMAGRVRSLDYKTIRYPGHRDHMAFLIDELRLGERRALLKDILEYSLPVTWQDVVLVFCTVTGRKDGQLTQVSSARKIYHAEKLGEPLSAIQLTTAAALCAVVDLHREQKLPERGFVRQEDVALPLFLANRFGRVFHEHARPLTVEIPARGESDARA